MRRNSNEPERGGTGLLRGTPRARPRRRRPVGHAPGGTAASRSRTPDAALGSRPAPRDHTRRSPGAANPDPGQSAPRTSPGRCRARLRGARLPLSVPQDRCSGMGLDRSFKGGPEWESLRRATPAQGNTIKGQDVLDDRVSAPARGPSFHGRAFVPATGPAVPPHKSFSHGGLRATFPCENGRNPVFQRELPSGLDGEVRMSANECGQQGNRGLIPCKARERDPWLSTR